MDTSGLELERGSLNLTTHDQGQDASIPSKGLYISTYSASHKYSRFPQLLLLLPSSHPSDYHHERGQHAPPKEIVPPFLELISTCFVVERELRLGTWAPAAGDTNSAAVAPPGWWGRVSPLRRAIIQSSPHVRREVHRPLSSSQRNQRIRIDTFLTYWVKEAIPSTTTCG
ncbi:uncharacterized protein BP5553_08153 [Venustampulla echinocandica]|uniref:Uncharacterized protein n=1 Tax=Venustampulla echinocandica TaxID=2656787 RepID=A0A370TFW6_9HELO|nr:uncharacterized protein BP5553_08153 [Venustampulla echinocandica]RDL33785.1 hypothetical protein BP5553_08153 [Venustampulla echinocandica]